MCKKLIITISIFCLYLSNVSTEEKIIKSLQNGGNIIFIRHAMAPGSGDPENFKLNDCSTQRNLNHEGIKQSKKIGLFFIRNKIPVEKVLSSEWCRCKDTAKYAFGNFKKFDALNSFYDERFAANKTKQIEDFKEYIKNWNGENNLVFVTHYVVISAILKIGVSSGEIIISDKSFEVIGSIETM